MPIGVSDRAQGLHNFIRRLVSSPHRDDHEVSPHIELDKIGGRIVIRFSESAGVEELYKRRLVIRKTEDISVPRLGPKAFPDDCLFGSSQAADDGGLARSRLADEPEKGNWGHCEKFRPFAVKLVVAGL